jgi:hypothetical protein
MFFFALEYLAHGSWYLLDSSVLPLEQGWSNVSASGERGETNDGKGPGTWICESNERLKCYAQAHSMYLLESCCVVVNAASAQALCSLLSLVLRAYLTSITFSGPGVIEWHILRPQTSGHPGSWIAVTIARSVSWVTSFHPCRLAISRKKSLRAAVPRRLVSTSGRLHAACPCASLGPRSAGLSARSTSCLKNPAMVRSEQHHSLAAMVSDFLSTVTGRAFQ